MGVPSQIDAHQPDVRDKNNEWMKKETKKKAKVDKVQLPKTFCRPKNCQRDSSFAPWGAQKQRQRIWGHFPLCNEWMNIMRCHAIEILTRRREFGQCCVHNCSAFALETTFWSCKLNTGCNKSWIFRESQFFMVLFDHYFEFFSVSDCFLAALSQLFVYILSFLSKFNFAEKFSAFLGFSRSTLC